MARKTWVTAKWELEYKIRDREETQPQRLDIFSGDWGQGSGWVGDQGECTMLRLRATSYHLVAIRTQWAQPGLIFSYGNCET